MSWLRIEGRMPQHHKIAPLSDVAFRLHITAMAWSVESKSDGRIPIGVPRTLTCAPRGKALSDALSELVTAKVWLSLGDDGYEIHDFLQWNLSAKEIAARSEAKAIAGQAGGRARAKHLLESSLRDAQAKPKPLSLPKSLPERDPPPPSVGPPLRVDRDISEGDLASFAPEPAKIRVKRPPKSQWRRFPLDFEPDETHRKLASELGLNLAQQLAEIRDHEFQKPKSDAAATLRTWLRNAPKFGTPTLGAPRAQRLDPRNEAQDRNADHDTRERLAAAKKVREMSEFADRMAAEERS